MSHIYTCLLLFKIGLLLHQFTTTQAVPAFRDNLKDCDEIQPLHLHGSRSKRDLSTRNKDGKHLPDTKLLLSSGKYGVEFHVNLQLNRDLFTRNFHIKYQLPSGVFAKSKKQIDHCYYHGTIDGIPESTVAFSTCNNLRGIIYNGKDVYYIHPANDSKEAFDGNHLFFHSTDLISINSSCGTTPDDMQNAFMNDMFNAHTMVRRATAINEQKHISLVMAVDKRIFDKFGGYLSQAEARGMEVANYVDAVYKTINSRVALVWLEIWNVFDLIHVSTSPGATLGAFNQYNRQVLVRERSYNYDNMQLLSGIDFDGSTVGMASVGTICTQTSAGVNMDHSTASFISANTVAHELGHNLGMYHDEDGCACSRPPCVMSSTASRTKVNGFTTCSIASYDAKLKSGTASCLFDIPAKLFGDPVCGNDYLEEGEECDCGSTLECKNNGGSACCDATTCKLKSTAQCAVGPCCENCQFKERGILCRDSASECDLAEYCSGSSGLCPGNFYKKDGMDCANGEAYCYDGGCQTITDQCLTLWGEGELLALSYAQPLVYNEKLDKSAQKAADICFNRLNIKGDEWGNCGQDLRNNHFQCKIEDVFCGKLHCKDMISRFPIVGSNKRIITYSLGGVPCKSGITSLGDDPDDPTIAVDGTKCNDNHLCLNHTCRNITTIESIQGCPGGCPNGGICNNMGHCHCAKGFSCPECTRAGPGGSVDSGQGCTAIPGGEGGLSSTVIGLLVFFLVFVPLFLLIGYLLYRNRHNLSRSNGLFKKRQQRRSFTQINRPNDKIPSPLLIGQPQKLIVAPNGSNTTLPVKTKPLPQIRTDPEQYGQPIRPSPPPLPSFKPSAPSIEHKPAPPVTDRYQPNRPPPPPKPPSVLGISPPIVKPKPSGRSQPPPVPPKV